MAWGPINIGGGGSVDTDAFVLKSSVGTPSGVAGLGTDGKVPASQLPSLGGHVVSASQPTNTNLLWVDTSNGGVLKYYNGSAWVGIAAVYA